MVGKEKVGDRDAYVISISNEKDPLAKLITIWVDIERYIPLKEEYTVTEGEKDKVKEVNKTIMYKDVTQMDDGRWMPHKIETYASGKMTTYIIYRQSAINVGLPPNLFAPDDPSLAPR